MPTSPLLMLWHLAIEFWPGVHHHPNLLLEPNLWYYYGCIEYHSLFKRFNFFFIENPAIMGCEVEILLEIPLLIQLICGRRNLLFVFCNCLLDAFVICIHRYVPCGHNYITNIVRDTTRKKVHFGRTMHCLPQSLKSTFFEIFSSGTT